MEELTTTTSLTTATHRKTTARKARAKAKASRWTLVETGQSSDTASTVSYPSHTHDRSSRVQFRDERLDHGSDNQFPVFRRAGAES